MIDFDALCLAPLMTIFGREATLIPLRSQPGVPGYPIRGVWEVKQVDIPTEDGGIMSGASLSMGVRLSEFSVAPIQGDQVDIPVCLSLPATGLHWIDDVDDDSDGGSNWLLKKVNP